MCCLVLLVCPQMYLKSCTCMLCRRTRLHFPPFEFWRAQTVPRAIHCNQNRPNGWVDHKRRVFEFFVGGTYRAQAGKLPKINPCDNRYFRHLSSLFMGNRRIILVANYTQIYRQAVLPWPHDLTRLKTKREALDSRSGVKYANVRSQPWEQHLEDKSPSFGYTIGVVYSPT